MGPLAKLYSACLNARLEALATAGNWRAATQAGFRRRHRLEDLIIPLDYLISRAQRTRESLSICFVDLEKAFDTVPRRLLMSVLLDEYGLSADMVETVRRMYADTTGTVPGVEGSFHSTMGVKQGCPLSPLLFSLYFDRVAEYIRSRVPAGAAVYVTGLAILAALYADDLLLLAPSPTYL